MIEQIKRYIINLTGLTPQKAHFFGSMGLVIFFAYIAQGLTIGYSALFGFGIATVINVVIEVLDYIRKGFVDMEDVWYDFGGQVAGATVFITIASIWQAVI